jgi:anaerobic magnesium-protoporphyrin IX monomethyl ester cyclase
MRVTLINPHTLIQPNDPLTTGIYYFPITLAYLAASLRDKGHDVSVIDAFGEAPTRVERWRNWWIQGLALTAILDRAAADPESPIFIYAGNLVSHEATLRIIRALKERCPQRRRIVVENTQAVTAYALKRVLPEFFAAGAELVLTGECEQRGPQLLEVIDQPQSWPNVDGLYWQEGAQTRGSDPTAPIGDLDALPFPAWDLFPLKNYWRLRYAHGPVTEKRWLPLLTSRGCPYPCHFCVVPSTNGLKWRSRSAESVTREMAHWQKELAIREFHIEDLNPTVDEHRIRQLCAAIVAGNLDVTWKIVAGTKLDALKDLSTLQQMAAAGCRYISFSPESGSADVLKRMGKPFRHDAAVEMTQEMSRLGIRTQACFVVGYPEESDADRQLTRDYLRRLVKAGLDEVALFICTPAPGSSIYGDERGYQSLSELSFSPTWRATYAKLSEFRRGTYARFMAWKLLHHPKKLLLQPFHFLRRRFHTKMEMTPFRALSLTMWRWLHQPSK